MSRQILITVLMLIASGSYLRSQIRTRVDLVVVPVSVKDAKGKLVTGLTKDDFIVREDGKVQTITNFDTVPQPLSVAIVVDDGMNGNLLRYLYPKLLPSTFETLLAGFAPGDRVTAFRYDHEVAQLSDFTDEPAAIETRLASLEKFAETRRNETADVLGEKGPRALRSVINVLGSTLPEERPTYGVLHDAIYQAALALQSEPAEHRKIVLFISDGLVAGPNVHTFASTTELLLKNRIQFYGVSTKFATFGSYGTLTAYARAAGGDVYPGTSAKSIESAFSKVTEQARYEYVLGYVSNNETQLAVFRNIKVRTRSANQTVFHRTGYVQYPQP
jgi:VWFA-related protein